MLRVEKLAWREVLVFSCAFLLLAISGTTRAEELRIGGTGTAIGTLRLLAAEYSEKHPETRIRIVPNLGSSGGIKAVLGAAIDLAVTSRPLKQEERQLGASEQEYARTPLVFAVAAKATVDAITRQELAGIYAGTRTKWPDGSPIRVILRPPSDIDSDLVKGFSAEVRQGVSAAEARPGVKIALTDQDAANDLEKIPGAVGPTSLALIISEHRALKALQLDGIQPTLQNAASQAYPYSKRLFLVTGTRRSTAAESFSVFVRSPAGRKILVANGHWLP
ncbi:MAG: substrate-binding domain-containing protein [Sterolibacterium sp.]|nr:substrate-binding domain-containing protein [Sterolibacterium sp.]